MGYLITVSFILHFISFFIIIILFQRQTKYQPDQKKEMKEMEDMLLSFTEEMKENNEKLVKLISKNSAVSVKKTNYTEAQEDQLPSIKPNHQNNLEEQSPVFDHRMMGEDDYEKYEPPVPEEEAIEVNTSSTSQVLKLHKDGLTVDEIAKKLEMGAGEVQLLLKFYK
ncbi:MULTISPECIES: DUF6115 domain-containing protein [Bacillaceae]|uniref:Swarming motility protein SwrB n=1 Tax=Evansella alkalicola TaxID=745819 RepID=A0ABS6JP55_9BACI|nr:MULTISPECIES: hypothetical protein [Bacillaceae]MBU9720347.1 hypothetical protein [Bacillus alkalicola]